MPRSKKDIDKEKMYKKLLPTSAILEEQLEVQPQPVAAASILEPQPYRAAPEEAAALPVQPAPAAVPVQPEAAPAAVPTPTPVPAQPEAAPPAVKPLPQPVNLMESFVEARINDAMSRFKCCTCEKCRKDILALTLNKLQPFYVIEDDANVRDQKEKERASEVATALVQSILVVKANPSH